MEHKHRFWVKFRAVGVWRNQYGTGTRIAYAGVECGCGCARSAEEEPSRFADREWRRRQSRGWREQLKAA